MSETADDVIRRYLLDNSVDTVHNEYMTNTQTTDKPFVLHRTGPQCWYAMEVATRDLGGVNFKTKKAAQAIVDDKNERRGF